MMPGPWGSVLARAMRMWTGAQVVFVLSCGMGEASAMLRRMGVRRSGKNITTV
jgi:hypothetical protein